MTEFVQVSTTVDKKRSADKIAQRLLTERLASCVQVLGPIESRYWWKGNVEHTKEWLCLIKARESDYRKIESAIKEIHTYQVPEVIALPVLRGSSQYLTWIKHETNRERKQG